MLLTQKLHNEVQAMEPAKSFAKTKTSLVVLYRDSFLLPDSSAIFSRVFAVSNYSLFLFTDAAKHFTALVNEILNLSIILKFFYQRSL